jgi:hypothetical protein
VSSPYGLPQAMGITDDTINAPIYQAMLQVTNCPSDPVNAQQFFRLPNTPTDFYTSNGARRSSYLFSTAQIVDYSASYNYYAGLSYSTVVNGVTISVGYNGVFGNDGAARLGDILDGSSNTIAIGECKQIKSTSSVFGPFWGAGIHTCCHGYTPNNDVRFTVNGRFNPDPNGQYAWGFGSHHTGGAHFLMGDGAVRFISENMDLQILEHLGSFSDGKPAGGFN